MDRKRNAQDWGGLGQTFKKKKRTKDLGGDIELFLAETRDTGIQQEMSLAWNFQEGKSLGAAQVDKWARNHPAFPTKVNVRSCWSWGMEHISQGAVHRTRKRTPTKSNKGVGVWRKQGRGCLRSERGKGFFFFEETNYQSLQGNLER